MNEPLETLDVAAADLTKPPDIVPAGPANGFPERVQTEEKSGPSGDLLDKLMNLASSMVLGRNKLVRLAEKEAAAVEGLKAKAIEKGLISPEAAARMTPAEACQIVFIPGFSTAGPDGADSGRRGGMGAVKSSIEKLGGDVEVESEPGRGTAVSIRLPLTLAIIPALVVTCGGQAFAVPQINLEEIVLPGPNCPLESLGSGLVIRLREALLPVLDLAEILRQSQAAPNARSLLVLQHDHSRFGLLVDSISNTEEIVVKPLARELKSVPFYSGATLLGQGDIALILDPAALAQGLLNAAGYGLANKSITLHVACPNDKSSRDDVPDLLRQAASQAASQPRQKPGAIGG